MRRVAVVRDSQLHHSLHELAGRHRFVPYINYVTPLPQILESANAADDGTMVWDQGLTIDYDDFVVPM